jgi:hypothetical protein
MHVWCKVKYVDVNIVLMRLICLTLTKSKSVSKMADVVVTSKIR